MIMHIYTCTTIHAHRYDLRIASAHVAGLGFHPVNLRLECYAELCHVIERSIHEHRDPHSQFGLMDLAMVRTPSRGWSSTRDAGSLQLLREALFPVHVRPDPTYSHSAHWQKAEGRRQEAGVDVDVNRTRTRKPGTQTEGSVHPVSTSERRTRAPRPRH